MARANGEGSIRYNEQRGRWEGRATVGIDDNGKLRRRTVTVTGKNDARTRKAVERKLTELLTAVDNGVDLGRDVTVARALREWVEVVLPGTVSSATLEQYRYYVAHYIVPELGRQHLRTLTPRDVTAMLRRQEVAGLSPNTRRLTRSILRRALRWAETEGMVARNVAALAHAPNVPASEGRTLTIDEARLFLEAAASDRLAGLWNVMLGLGLRISEALGVAWDDLADDRLTVRRSLKYVPGTGLELGDTKTPKSRRTLILPPQLAAALRDHRRRQTTERLAAGPAWTMLPLGVDLMFRTPLGTALDPSNVRHYLSAITTAAGAVYDEAGDMIDGSGLGHWTPHELRHSAASLLIAAGVPIAVVSSTLGHSSSTVTSAVYHHLLDSSRAEAADAIERTLWGAR